jgi:hypothetical protein
MVAAATNLENLAQSSITGYTLAHYHLPDFPAQCMRPEGLLCLSCPDSLETSEGRTIEKMSLVREELKSRHHKAESPWEAGAGPQGQANRAQG